MTHWAVQRRELRLLLGGWCLDAFMTIVPKDDISTEMLLGIRDQMLRWRADIERRA